MRRSVLVTGASGFIGSHLVEHLSRQGWDVRALLLPGEALGRRDVEEFTVSDITHSGGVRRAVAGATAVVHAAGRAHRLRESTTESETGNWTVNVEGTRVVAEAAAEAGVSRLVYLSSVGAVCQTSEDVVSADVVPAPVTPYGRSKLAAERVLGEISGRTRMATPIIRPPLAYGPRMRGNPLRLMRLLDGRWPVPLSAIHNCRSFVYVGNLVGSVLSLLEAPPTSASFFVSDAHDVSTPEFVRMMARALGVVPRMVPMPPALLRLAGRVGDALPTWVPFPLSTDSVLGLTGSLRVDSAPLTSFSGWSPPFSVEAGLSETAAWFRACP